MGSTDGLEKRLSRLEKGLTKVQLPGGGETIITPPEAARGLVLAMQASLGMPADQHELQSWADIQAKEGMLGAVVALARRALQDGPPSSEELAAIAKSCDGDFAPNSGSPADDHGKDESGR